MRLEGSCHCGAVRFRLDSHTPQPYLRCYCTICRKTAGGGGYAVNIMGDAATLRVRGRAHLRTYRALVEEAGHRVRSPNRRHFCGLCGSALWCADPRWPQWVYPFASAIDTPLPVSPERAHIMVASAAVWVVVPRGRRERRFAGYPDSSIADWHRLRGLDVA